jgi:hypothetical protein
VFDPPLLAAAEFRFKKCKMIITLISCIPHIFKTCHRALCTKCRYFPSAANYCTRHVMLPSHYRGHSSLHNLVFVIVQQVLVITCAPGPRIASNTFPFRFSLPQAPLPFYYYYSCCQTPTRNLNLIQSRNATCPSIQVSHKL